MLLNVLGCRLTYWGQAAERPAREHGSVLLYVHGNHKAHSDGKPRTAATSTFTQLLNSDAYITDLDHTFCTKADISWNTRRCSSLLSRSGSVDMGSTTRLD